MLAKRREFCSFCKLLEGCTITQIITHHICTVHAKVWSKGSRYGICGRQSCATVFPCHLFHQGPIFIFVYQIVDSLAQKATNKEVAWGRYFHNKSCTWL